MDQHRRQQQDQHRRGTSNNPNSPPYGQQTPQQQQAHSSHGQQAQGYQGGMEGSYAAGQPVGTSNNYLPAQQSANPHLRDGHQLQSHQSNIEGLYTGGPPVGASQNHGRPNQRPVNQPHVGQPQGYTNDTAGQYAARSTFSIEGGSISQTTPNLQGAHAGNSPSMGLQIPTLPSPLQSGYSPQGTPLGQGWNAMNPPTGVPLCKLPDCRRPRFFHNGVQQLLDYCQRHLDTAIEKGYAAGCKRCRLPAIEGSEYCSQLCGNVDGVIVRQRPIQPQAVTVTASVPQGFAPSCKECRRPVAENAVVGGNFCSQECWYYHTHPSGH